MNFQGHLYAISGETSEERQRSLVESRFCADDQRMDWQTSTTLLIFAIAAGILLRRVGGFLRSGKTGSCGSCAGCGDSAKDTVPLQLVPLGSGSAPTKFAANSLKPVDAEAEKTG
jgi:hypothetical protein